MSTPASGEFDPAEISRALLLSTNDLVVLDENLPGVYRFSWPNGQVLQFGRRGAGPGEFLRPSAMAIDGRGSVFVLDVALRRVSRYWIADGAFLGSFQLAFMPRGMCVADQRIYVLSAASERDGRLVHRFHYDGRFERAFGAPLTPAGSLMALVLGGARVQCLSGGSVILVGSEVLGTIRGYDTAGALRWETALPGFRQLRARRMRNGGVLMVIPEAGSDAVTFAQLASLSAAYLQTDRRYPTSVDYLQPDRRSFMVGLLAGHVSEMQDGLPRFVAEHNGRLLIDDSAGLALCSVDVLRRR